MWSFPRILSAKSMGEKRRKEQTLVAWQKKRGLQGERGGKKRRIAAQVNTASFTSSRVQG